MKGIIYKITSPTGKIYIGQTIDIKRRKADYRLCRNIKQQPKIYNSILKYGFINHTFEILEECDVTNLNERERYYQELYVSTSNKHLNCILTKCPGQAGKLSDEHKSKLSKNSGQAKKVIDTKTNIVYDSLTQACKLLNLNYGYMMNIMQGYRRNTTTLIWFKTNNNGKSH
jgi:group I intron endonuclease